ncbi:hypothetical protein DPMN_076707 [Dreissena polymorpha]|uniref:Uncharacterized protein n=1 Tax=Dreissena polymorpha TaxID=45954 RepID=A0A9D3YJ74_DREPO|nr:hypothetical protein DPMN_076707 [Dreissena polymorpha]
MLCQYIHIIFVYFIAFLDGFGITLVEQLVQEIQEAFSEQSAVLEALSVLPPRTELVGYGKELIINRDNPAMCLS